MSTQSSRRAWSHLSASGGMGMEEQWLRRASNGTQGDAPALRLHRDDDERWCATLLELSGISVRFLFYGNDLTLEEAKRAAEADAADMGWTL